MLYLWHRLQGNAVDTVPFTAWANFEHDCRILTVYMVDANAQFSADCRDVETPQALYRLVVPYQSIDHVAYDAPIMRAEDDCHALYLKLSYPPQVRASWAIHLAS